jgi:lipocalin-like protein
MNHSKSNARILVLAVSLATILSLGCLAVASDSIGQSGSAKEQLSGTWKLVSWKIVKANGELADPYMGPNLSGWLMYHPSGHMCGALMRPERAKFASNNAVGGTPEEIKAAFEGYLGYCGSYEVNQQERFVIHRVQLSWFPNWLGTEQKRFFELAGDRLTITAPPLTGLGEVTTHRLIWERLK